MTSEVRAPHAPDRQDAGSPPPPPRRARLLWRAFGLAFGSVAAAFALVLVGVGVIGAWEVSAFGPAQLEDVGFDVWASASATANMLLPGLVLLLGASAEQSRRGRPWLVPAVAGVVIAGWFVLAAVAIRGWEEHMGEDGWPARWSDWFLVGLGDSALGSWPGAAAPWVWSDDDGVRWPTRRWVTDTYTFEGGTHRVASVGLLTPLVIAGAVALVIWVGARLARGMRPGPTTATWARTAAIVVVLVPTSAVLAAAVVWGGENDTSWAIGSAGLVAPALVIALAVLAVGLHRATWAVIGLLTLTLAVAPLSQWWAGGADTYLLEAAVLVIPPLACCAAVPLARRLTAVTR